MNRRIFVISVFCFILFALGLSAQDTWIKNYQPFGEDVSYFVEDIRVCPDEGYAVIGSIWDEWEGNRGYLMKTDNDGNLQWASIDTVNFIGNPEPSGFVVLEDGSFITVGNDLGFGNSYLLKRNSDGIIQWVEELDAGYRTEAIELTNDGNLITTGGATMEDPINLQKFDLDGNLIWRQTYLPDGFEYGQGNSVIQTFDGGYALTGYVYGIDNNDILVIKTNVAGDSLWSWTFDGFGAIDRGNCIIEDSNQDIYISGVSYNYTRAMYTYIAKLNNYGDSLWINVIPEMAECFSILRTNNNLIGYSWSGSSSNKTRLFQFNEEGEIIWDEQLDHWPAEGDRCFQELDNGNFVCSGKARWGDNIAITKCDSMGLFSAINEDILVPYDNYLKCYPNPFNPELTISFTISEPSEIEINIFNVKGQLVDVVLQERKTCGFYSISWNAINYSSGLYFIQLKQNNKLANIQKISLIK
jgi:hypothetical protein